MTMIGARRTQRRRSLRVAQTLTGNRRRAIPAAFGRQRARAVRDPDTGCLVAGPPDHYARTWVDGRCRGAHRVAFEVANGPIPDGAWVLHRCIARKSCIEPGHLYAGNASQNMQDTLRAGRKAKLTPAAVLAIRNAPKTEPARRELAAALGVTPAHVRAVQDRRCWRWVADGTAT